MANTVEPQLRSEAERRRELASRATRTAASNMSFRDFGVLDTGKQGRGSVLTSVVINGTLLLLAITVSLTAKKIVTQQKNIVLTAPVELPKNPPPPPPKVKLPPPPKIARVEPPKIKLPTVEVKEPPKIQPPVFKPSPVVVNTPAPPKAVTPPPAPKPIHVAIAQAASVPNNSAHPSPVRLGSLNNPIANTSGPAVSPINLGRSGAPGMPAGNTGMGNPTKIAIAGSGSPNGSMGGHDNAARPIRGISTGVPGGTGPATARPVAGTIQIARNEGPARIPTSVQPASAPKTPPKVLYKPKPLYTEAARNAHIEGEVQVRIRVSNSGAVQVLGISNGLGHGLDQEALRAAQGMRFSPATQNGQPVDWEGTVTFTFQLAG